MSQLPTPKEIQESRRQSLLQKHADGGRLSAEQLSEIQDLIGIAPKHQVSFDSMTSAAKILGVPMAEIKRAKTGGCKGFRNGRIYRQNLIDWLADNSTTPTATPGTSPTTIPSGVVIEATDAEMESRKLAAQTLKAELELDKAKERVIDRDLVRTEWSTHLTQIFDILDKSLDRGIYNSIAKEVKLYLGQYAK